MNLLFMICNTAVKVAELHFPAGQEFHDLIMKTNFTSQSRAKAFLWIMWFYLESDFTEEGCDENPFGPGVDYGLDVANQGVPRLVEMTTEEEALENVDPQEEIDFGKEKQVTRAKIIAADQQFLVETQNKRGGRGRAFPSAAIGDDSGPTTGILPRIRPAKHESDHDSVRSTPPRVIKSVAASTSRRGPHSLKYVVDGSSPGGTALEGIVARKPRPPTAHQIAVERNRSQRVEYILDRGIRKSHHRSRKERRQEGSVIRALHRLERIQRLEDNFDNSEDEDTVSLNKQALQIGNINVHTDIFREKGMGGLCQLKDEPDDFGEECAAFANALRRTHRRLTRWENHSGPPLGIIAPVKRPKVSNGTVNGDNSDMEMDGSPSKYQVDPAETEDEGEMAPRRQNKPAPRRGPQTNGTSHRLDANGDTPMEEADDLDDVDRGLLGLDDDNGVEGEGEGEGEGEDELDDVDKTLLGLGDSDSE